MFGTAAGWALLLLAVVVSGMPDCRKFEEESITEGQSKTYWCSSYEECRDGKVYGTDEYHEDSSICQAALHSGVIISLPSNISITRRTKEKGTFLATAKNRILSVERERNGAQAAYKVNSTVQESGAVGEVMLVHKIPEEGSIKCVCLSQDQESPISSSNIKTWDFRGAKADKISGDGSPKLEFELSMQDNHHTVRLLGTKRDEDVLAVIQYPEADYQALSATVRASLDDDVTIEFRKKGGFSDRVYFKKLPGFWPKGPSHELPLRLSPARPSDTGIYIVHNNKKRRDVLGAYYDVLVRGCRKGFYGVACAKICPECLNGGQCHSQRGTCLCPPGFIGDKCQYACPPGFFGNECQFKCHGRTVALRDSQESEGEGHNEKTDNDDENKEAVCKGFTICLPPPYGCSCAAGFTHPSEIGKTCTRRCPKGRYGADCEQKCDDCEDGECHSYSGTCKNGCKSGQECRKGPPRPSLSLTSRSRGYSASWDAAEDSSTYYFVSQQLLKRLSCPSMSTQKPLMYLKHVTTPTYETNALLPFAAYNVCVVASSTKGLTSPECSTVNTSPEAPSMNITKVECEETSGKLQCDADVSGDCNDYNGPNVSIMFNLRTNLSCNSSLTNLTKTVPLSGQSGRAIFDDYLAGKTYNGKAIVQNNAGVGHKQSFNFTTKPKPPPPVQNLTHDILSDTIIRLLWNDPCPSNGDIEEIYASSLNNTSLPVKPCQVKQEYDRCHNFTGFSLGKEYNFSIKMKNKNTDWGKMESYKVKLEEKEPGPPRSIKAIRGAQHLNLTLESPTYPGGTLINCIITLAHSNRYCLINVEGATSMICEFSELEEGRIEEAEAWCCNRKFCGSHHKQSVATQPLPPLLQGNISVVRKTNTTITLRIPAVNRQGDGNISVIVFVQPDSRKKSFNTTAEVMKLFEARLNKAKGREQIWIAAELDQLQGHIDFVVGDGKTYKNFSNYPLKRGEIYNVGLMGVNKLLGATNYSAIKSKDAVKVEPYDPPPSPPSNLLYLLIIPAAIVFMIIIIAYYRLSERSGDQARYVKCIKEEEAETHALHDTDLNLAVSLPKDAVENDNSCENLKPSLCAENATKVPYAEVEAYLNKVIGSTEASEDFKAVPRILTKRRTAAERQENTAKNRYKNILPYDDTRVVLSCLNDDPSSDYINASHVEGYGGMRYIASQGPKEANVSTIADFWRMVVEQRITVIIMLANFIENDKNKVGEYFSPKHTLNFDGFEVTLISKAQQRNFTTSSITVRWKGQAYQVQHYHYRSWPDHGVPTEGISIAQMLRDFRFHHRQGGTVVHCSAGKGRTGTVLQVLLMCEMLSHRGYLSPLEVLARLRMSRPLMVENEAQYNFSLEILEEVLFGKATIISPDYLEKHQLECVLSSKDQYAKAKALPSPLTYNTSNLPLFLPLNRNQAVLPADSNRYHLKPKAGIQTETSQYINAILVLGLDKSKFILATEHPMPNTLANFWRLIAETRSTLVFLINSLEQEDDKTYPTLLRGRGRMWKIDEFQVKQEETEAYEALLTHSKLTITSKVQMNWIHHVDVYQSNKWPPFCPLPPSTHLLLKFANLLQVPRRPDAGPPLLCCSDGVTGCGLVAGMALVVEQLKTEQEIDVYRTVVKLLRARQQFIVSEEQFSTLYKGAALYLQEYSDYGNFQ